ncbi:hypothetical protein Tco_0172783 [Tanacetum coccineum]
MHEIVKKEIVKLLDTDIIYPIADSPWASSIHCVTKKGGITVVTNENDELVPTRTVTGWRVCIDYRKLNEATAKDHFHLPFMDQMLERLAENNISCLSSLCMTRSSTKELLSPFENPIQKFRSRRRLFDTPSLLESNSQEFDHNFKIEENSEEEGQFLKELRDNTFSGSEHEDANEHIEKKWHNGKSSRTRSTETSNGLAAIQAQLNNLGREIKKVNEKVYAAQVGCELCKGPHYTKDCLQKEEGKTLEESYYTQFGAPYQPGGQYKAAGPGFYQ